MKSSLKETLLVTVISCSLIGGGVGYVGGQYLNKQSEDLRIEREEASDKLWDEAFGINHEATAQAKALDHAESWTFRMTRMPNIPERTDMANSLLKALDDNVISDDENKMLATQFAQLQTIVVNQRTKNDAAKIAAGVDGAAGVDAGKDMNMAANERFAAYSKLRESAYQQWALKMEADSDLSELRKINGLNN